MIGTSRDGDVVTIELQREDRRNALNTELCVLLRDAVDEVVADGARVIVLTGQGRAFCAGADLSGDVYADGFTDTLLEMLHTIDSAPIPVIAAINGPAVGAGTQLAIASDLRVVTPDAFFAIPAVKLGISVDSWTVKRLSSLVGGGPARTVLLGAEQISAADAYTFGLANKIGDLAAAQEWAKRIAALAPLSLRHLKMVFNDDGTQDEAPQDQLDALHAAWSSEDMLEASRARHEKRTPTFRGR
ncbi:putative enoyl-CoA hydratase echA6 [Rhodococcus sp. RD6.2]|jgi:enoyl-CoA hydratase|uniref:enoyl-CoA hydratase n=1 Tax=Rhodococcus sp. RD6.2 TaxID=260936 RepID=UPI00063BC202|nr:enoyl-CoA hydratase [Rhodococcus sp. RD6.2]CRK53663.1 putative enoyl-CoA hydratase echA6 [Rhodococcus sp. RD6.2]